jgi:CDGSH-type Zn-finger protein/uncharacterized Fe-S cluster protein YjdI
LPRVHVYRGELLNITFDRERCIHAAECLHGLPDVFNLGAKPWVDPDGARPEFIRQTVRRCPSGALKIEGEIESLAHTAECWILADGPLILRGRLRVLDAEGNPKQRDYRMALCRCGVSQNKPFCDNRHRAVRFADDAKIAGEAALGQLDAGHGHVDLTPVADSHLLAEGPVLIRDATGRVRYAGMETHLCRCGGSKRKPFCDGSHITVGFRG